MGITITNAARGQVKTILDGQECNTIRFGVRGGGCSGFSYIFEMASEGPTEKDKVFQFGSFQICIDLKSYFFVNGTEIDWVDKLMGRHFTFDSPNAASTCGCGTSVSFEVNTQEDAKEANDDESKL